MRKNAYEILNVRSEITKRQSRSAALVEGIGRALADPMFFIGLLAGHLLWVVLNLPIFPWFEPWDPYPSSCWPPSRPPRRRSSPC